MSKLLYITFRDRSANHFGIGKKIKSQCTVFESKGFTVSLIERNDKNTIIETSASPAQIIGKQKINSENPKMKNFISKYYQIKAIKEHLKKNTYENVYIRYDLSDPQFLSLLKSIKKQGSKIVLEIPTYPYKKEYSKTNLHKLKYYIDSIFAMRLKKYVDKIVTFYATKEKIHGVDTMVLPNGYDFAQMDLINTSIEKDPNKINIIGVASMREWHGYERFILGLKEYYKEPRIRKVFFHIVGDGRELGKYKKLVKENNLQEYIYFHGVLQGKQLDELFDTSDIGIDSLARHRTNITVLSSLKSREYGAKGLPFINSCDIDILDDEFKYLLKVSDNESSIEINKIVDFYDYVYSSGKSRKKIALEIRNHIKSKADMSITLQPVSDFFYR